MFLNDDRGESLEEDARAVVDRQGSVQENSWEHKTGFSLGVLHHVGCSQKDCGTPGGGILDRALRT